MARFSSDMIGVFFYAAAGSLCLAGGLRVAGKKDTSLFVGQWVPTILILAFYNKLVKVAGSDRVTAEPGRPIN